VVILIQRKQVLPKGRIISTKADSASPPTKKATRLGGFPLANNPNFDTKSLFVAPFAETVSLFTVVITIIF